MKPQFAIKEDQKGELQTSHTYQFRGGKKILNTNQGNKIKYYCI